MPTLKTPRLSATQLIILSSASQREDGLASLPEKLKGGAAKAAVSKLLNEGLLKEVRVKRDQPSWRSDEEERSIGLKLTKGGATAISVEHDGGEEPEAAQPKRADKPPAEALEPGTGSKKALVLSLLSRPKGATIDDLLSATKWLPHTTRAALTRLRHEGYAFIKSKNAEGDIVYRTDKRGQVRRSKEVG